MNTGLKVEFRTSLNHGLETIQVWVNDVHATDHLSLAAAITWIKTKFPEIHSVRI